MWILMESGHELSNGSLYLISQMTSMNIILNFFSLNATWFWFYTQFINHSGFH